MTVTLCVLLWPRAGQEAGLIAYEDRVLPMVADHGGRVVQRARNDAGGDQPLEVHLLQFPSERNLDDYLGDDRRAALADARDAAIARTEVMRVDLV